jgi:16S rRNA G527 N7-methylase RsmG
MINAGMNIKRLDIQHTMTTKALNSLYWPVDEVRAVLKPREGNKTRILDIGSGSGIW